MACPPSRRPGDAKNRAAASDTLDLRGAAGGAELLPYEAVREHYLAAVRNHFARPVAEGGLGRPELLNRLGDNILVFDLLRPEHIAGICQKFLKILAVAALEKRKLRLDFSDGQIATMIRDRMMMADNLLFGGQRIKAILEASVERPLNRWIFFNEPPVGSAVEIRPAPSGDGILVNGGTVD